MQACSHTHRRAHARAHTDTHTEKPTNNLETCKYNSKSQDIRKTADLRGDPGLCGFLCVPHCEIPVIPVLTESSYAVVAVHVSANVPKDHIEDEEYGENKERY